MCDVDEPAIIDATDVLGVALGIVYIPTDSDGKRHRGEPVEKVRSRLARCRAGLQRRGTKAAKRRLRKLSGCQKRFQHHINYEIFKAIVTEVQRSGRTRVLGDLNSIRERIQARRRQRARCMTGLPVSFVPYRIQGEVGCAEYPREGERSHALWCRRLTR
jgi:hypothetical protein